MRRFFVLIALSISLSVLADSTTETIKGLLDLNQVLLTTESQLNVFRRLQGDTITFNIPSYNNVKIFTKEVSDTIWLKKRPNKNPREGKHYVLSNVYKGVPSDTDGYRTPTSEVNGKPFAVLSVNQIDADRFSAHKDISLKLIDLDDLSIVDCYIPHNLPFWFTISSNRINRKIDSLIGQEFYLLTGKSYRTQQYQRGKLRSGNYNIVINSSTSHSPMRSDIVLNFEDEIGNPINFKYEKNDFIFSEDPILSKDEYQDRYVVRTIDSDLRGDLVNSDIDMPFSFDYILGIPDSPLAHMSQRLDPKKANCLDWYTGDYYAPRDGMFVGGGITVKGIRFLKMIYNGKAFFMKEKDIKMTSEYSAKLDSLLSSSPEIQDIFFHKSLLLGQTIYCNKLEKALKDARSYKKYGLAIKSSRVYDESEYTDGRGFSITFFNPTDQTIKYISITFQGFNRVDDPYGRPVTKRCIGPIYPDETSTYNFKYVWHTDIVEYAEVRSITVTYMNGATRIINNASAVYFTDNILEMIYTTDPVDDFQ